MPTPAYTDPALELPTPAPLTALPSAWVAAVRDDVEHLVEPPHAVGRSDVPAEFINDDTGPSGVLPTDTSKAIHWKFLDEDTDGFFLELDPPSGYSIGGTTLQVPAGLGALYDLTVTTVWRGGTPPEEFDPDFEQIPVALELWIGGVYSRTLAADVLATTGYDQVLHGLAHGLRLDPTERIDVRARRTNPVGTTQIALRSAHLSIRKVSR